MLEKLEQIVVRYDELSKLISDSEVISKQQEWKNYCKEHSDLEIIVEKYNEYKKNYELINECEELLNSEDKEMQELAKEELHQAKLEKEKLEKDLKILLLPTDPNDDKNVVIEIRSGAGGEEAALFGQLVMRMYKRYAERMRWKVEDIDINETELGGIKEATFMISGSGAYSKLKYESGVHRVQRVPETESQGRVHTSTITVAVLPEIQDIDIDINEKDLKIDTYRSSGAGGQHVNKTESAIRITHLPTGMVVTSQDERSQIKNREKAMKVLASRLYDFYEQQRDKEYAANRKMQVGTGDRSERIRTYNFPQGRVTDHRIAFTLYSINEFLDGDIFEMIEKLQIEDQNAKLSNL